MSEDPQEVFQVLEKLGQGSYGTVRKCLDKRNGKIVAVKSIEKSEGDNLTGIMKEIKLLEKCNSPDIVSYYGCFDTPNELLIEMEYCAAGSALDLIKVCGRRFTEIEIAATMYFVLRGLDFLHKRKIIHRDIKAGNILLNAQGEAKLADFGVAIQLQSTFQKRATVTGSPYWMAPDVIDQKGDKGYTNKADLWSLGITAIELAEGEPPLYSVHFARVLFMIVRNPPPKLKEPSKWSPEFNDFLDKCLQKEPAARPSAEELLQHPFVQRGAKSVAVLAELTHACIPKIEATRIAHWKATEGASSNNSTGGSSMQPLSQSQFSDSMISGGSVLINDGTRSSTASSASSSGSMVINDGTRSSTASSASSYASSTGAGSIVLHSGDTLNGGTMISKDGTSASSGGSVLIHGGSMASSSGSVVIHNNASVGGSIVINDDPAQGGSILINGSPMSQGGSVKVPQPGDSIVKP